MANKSKRTQFGVHGNDESSFFTPFSHSKDQAILNLVLDDLQSGLSPDSPFYNCNISDFLGNVFTGYDYDHSSHRPINDIRRDRQMLSLLSKSLCAGNCTATERREKAIKLFYASERQCQKTNIRLSRFLDSDGFPSDVEPLLFLVQRKISKILGDVPDYDQLCCQFGNGASSNVRKITSVRHKLNSTLTCSSNVGKELAPFLASYIGFSYLHDAPEIDIGRYDTVPKNATVDRSIVMEPSLNTFVQKGFGSYMKQRLKQAGCNLYDQSVNQNLAKRGSISNDLSTIDLSSASDTVALVLVYLLLPSDWFDKLYAWRTPDVDIDGQTLRLAKFSSMGNGFTFELESLIFYSIASVIGEMYNCHPKDISVYGDDIIVPSRCSDKLISILEFFGFTINKHKSFVSGPFRESCGSDYFFGNNVRPFYKKDRFTPASLIGFLNFDARHYCLLSQETRKKLIRRIPKRYVLYGPDGYGDGHLIDIFDVDRGCFKAKPKSDEDRSSLSGTLFYTYKRVTMRHTDPLERHRPASLFAGEGPTQPIDRGDSLLPLYVCMIRDYSSSGPFLNRCADLSSLRQLTGNQWIPEPSIELDPFSIRGEGPSRKIRVYKL